MSTVAQMAANTANAQQSTGPITEEGKAASSLNALKHGLTANTVLLPGEDEAAYRALCDETLNHWKPADAHEKGLLQILCDTQWRLARCSRLEATALSADIPDFKTFDIISKHESRLKREYSSTLKDVTQIIAARIALEEALMKEAVIIRRADRLNKKETNFQAIGFDLSVTQVDLVINRENAFIRAKKVVFPTSAPIFTFKSAK